MRILAIRGCNLASLAGEFEIDLVRGPLGGAGVFAIVGATGAGKSTLLDAMCVALFDRTPRLTNRSTVTIGHGDDDPAALGAQDVRTILRRGATAGYAEVDFESGDSRRYRARWSVRRARDRSDGNLQAQQIKLTAIESGERFGGTRTETLDAIHHRLGLSFDQFRRSALLAQGEFAAFLRADGKDRSELLERMTGTEIYSRLSIAAHVKASQAEQQLRERRTAAQAIAVLDDDARRILEGELAVAEAAKLTARERLAIAETAARWISEAELRGVALVDARAHHATASAALARAAPERDELALRRRAEELRGPWEAQVRLARAVAIAGNELAEAELGDRRTSERQAAIAIRRGELARLHEPVRAARLAAGLVERIAETAAGVDARAAVAAEDAAWLVQRGGLAAEVAGWGELDARFDQRTVLAAAIGGAERTLRGHADARGKLVKVRVALAEELQAAAQKLDETKRRAATFQQRRELTLDAAKRAEDEARQRCTEVDRLVGLAAAARAAVVARGQLEDQLATLTADASSDRERYVAAETARATQTILRAERARVATELRRAAGYEHPRAELVDGEPCPLCGGIEHPWRGRGAFDDVIRAAEVQLGEATARLEMAAQTLVEVALRERQRAGEQTRLADAHAQVIESTASHAGIWRQQLTALGELLLVDEPASAAAERLAAERATAARARLEAARATRSQTEAATKAAADAQADMQLAQANLDQLGLRLADHDRRIGELEAAVERLRGELTLRAERQGELAAELTAAIARWGAALPVADRERLADRAREADVIVDRARARIAELATEWRARAERVGEADARFAVALREIDRDSREVERAVAEQTARLEHARQRCDVLAEELAEATRMLDGARARPVAIVEEATKPIGKRKARASNETVAAVAGSEALEIATDTLQRLLAGDAASALRTIGLLAEQIADLERAVERTATLVAERRRHVDEHAALRPPLPAEAVRGDELAAAVHEAEQLGQLVAKIGERLAADRDARVRRAAAEQAIAVAEAGAEIDRVLGEVIGSHDGKLFRSFAQSLTLDSLLAVANAHLEELAPRYQLERVPKHDLELQVIDRDLGGEVRSVQSLSGGESFLVSLALALGLSSMSAHDVRVRTLLIDEGFGTLDPVTLDSALSVLDALQSTGRQVGVISHVPALVERVGAHVRVIQRGGGRSEVIVAEA